MKPTKEWWDKFIEINQLVVGENDWRQQTDTPGWFQPTKNSIKYESRDFNQGSAYFRDTISGVCYIYEIQI